MKVLGVDEAGRGCVFGDLVIGGFMIEGEDDSALTQAGATDSKRLSPKRRRAVRDALGPLGQVVIHRISPAQIDVGNLNHLEEAAILSMVRECKPDRVIVDALGQPSTIPATLTRLNQAYPADWRMEPKADLNWPVVGAASIVAKTDRDDRLERLKADYGELGSGYPSEARVKRWLEAWYATGQPWPSFVRTRWETVKRLSR